MVLLLVVAVAREYGEKVIMVLVDKIMLLVDIQEVVVIKLTLLV